MLNMVGSEDQLLRILVLCTFFHGKFPSTFKP